MPSKSELKDQIQGSRQRFANAVKDVDARTLETLAICGVWTSRDVAGHLADWNLEFLAIADHATGGPTPARPAILDFEAFNTSHAEARKGQSWAEAYGDLDASVDSSLAALDSSSDEQLATVIPFPWGGEGELYHVFDGVAEHMDEHVVDLEEYLHDSSASAGSTRSQHA